MFHFGLFLSKQFNLFFIINTKRAAAKLAIVGSAVYVTVDNSIWDKSEYANKAITKVKQALPETTELIKNVTYFERNYFRENK
jgi:hypothetical protein